MRLRKYLNWGLLVILILFLSVIVFQNEVKRTVQSELNGELTMKEAIIQGLSAAKKWNKKASLVSVTSVDEKKGGSRGDTGRRYSWTLTFMVPKTDEHLLVGLSNGVITETRQLKGPKNIETFDIKEIVYDSPAIVEAAKHNYLLQPGEDWATGYHFTYGIVDSVPIITVFGIDNNKLFAKISFNALNGFETEALHKVPHGGGLVQLTKDENDPRYFFKNADIKGISSGNERLVMFGDREPREFNSLVDPFLLVSKDDGKSWASIKFNDVVLKSWFNEKDELFIATSNEIWADVAGHRDISLSLSDKIENIDTSGNNIAVLSNGYIHLTNDGNVWSKISVSKELRSIEVSSSGQLFVFTTENEIFQYKESRWMKVSKPRGLERFSAAIEDNNLLFISKETNLWILNLELNKWNEVPVPIDDEVINFFETGNQIFLISTRGGVYKLIEGGDGVGEWKAEKIFEIQNEIIRDLAFNQKGLYIATSPEYIWEVFKGGY
ncbi:hypothetical protein PAECIP111894_05941 [Paenibacillus pseudetheri]|uniref:Uncharacterized protein n=2 Tax=Paenibacillus pseudetheri TaxID=2897682 RepID=A0ABM9BMU9_9BACL|nr:hypothetical protein PAECIP111894_05941 [Paenibacillus pseudetheri]